MCVCIYTVINELNGCTLGCNCNLLFDRSIDSYCHHDVRRAE